MFYGVSDEDNLIATSVATPFSFHHGDEVLKGRALSPEGLVVFCPNQGTEAFHYKHRQKLKDCHIQIDGLTIYLCTLQVTELHDLNGEFVYGLRIDSILPQEKKQLQGIYEAKRCAEEAADGCDDAALAAV